MVRTDRKIFELLLSSSKELVLELIFLTILLGLMEIVHVELAHERRKVVVFEVFREDFLSKFIDIIHDKGSSFFVP